MGVAGNGSLQSGPSKNGQCPGWPAFITVRARIDLILQVQEAQVSERLRSETTDLDVVLHDRQRFAPLVGRWCKELLLMIEPWPPRQHAADVQTLTLDLTEHDRGILALGRKRVVCAAGSVNVVVTAEEAMGRRVDPPLEMNLDLGLLRWHRARGNRHLPLQPSILRSAAIEHREAARRQQDVFAVSSIDLFLKEEIRRDPLGLRRKHVPFLIDELKPSNRRRTVMIEHAELHRDGRPDGKQYRDLGAESQILCPLPEIKTDGGLTAPGF